jgi:probable HAF family extracellular repeat protein
MGPGQARKINNSGQVVGVNFGPAMTFNENQFAFLYSNGVTTNLGALLPGRLSSGAWGINNLGQVVGSDYDADYISHSFLYSNGVMTDLSTSACDPFIAVGINDAGQIVGTAMGEHTAICSNGVLSDLGSGPWSNGTFGNAINSSGQVIGDLNTATATHAFLYSNGAMIDLGTLGGTHSSAEGINDNGDVVGWSTTAGGGGAGAFLYRNGVMSDIGSLGSWGAGALAINNLGQIVGNSNVLGGGYHAFLYSGGVMMDLHPYLPPGSYLSEALAINDHGQIVGWYAAASGAPYAFVLTPIAVVDSTPPVLVVPANIAVDATSPSGAVVSYVATATDAVDPHPVVNCVPASGSTFAAGTTAVTCTATDASGNSATASFSVTVFGAVDQIADLIDLVNSFHLRRGIEISLDAELRLALRAAGEGRESIACVLLSAFIFEVQGLSGRSITTAQANQLIAAARQAKASLGCG